MTDTKTRHPWCQFVPAGERCPINRLLPDAAVLDDVLRGLEALHAQVALVRAEMLDQYRAAQGSDGPNEEE